MCAIYEHRIYIIAYICQFHYFYNKERQYMNNLFTLPTVPIMLLVYCV